MYKSNSMLTIGISKQLKDTKGLGDDDVAFLDALQQIMIL